MATEAWIQGPRFWSRPFDAALLDEAIRIARAARIRGCDAVYAALASTRDAPLLTLDGELADRLRAAVPALRIIP